MGASCTGSYEVTPPDRSRACGTARQADESIQRQQARVGLSVGQTQRAAPGTSSLSTGDDRQSSGPPNSGAGSQSSCRTVHPEPMSGDRLIDARLAAAGVSPGTSLGALVIGSFSNGMDLLGLASPIKLMITGVVLVTSVSFNSVMRRCRGR